MKKSFEELIQEHGQWADATFPKGTAMGAITHAKKKLKEVENAMWWNEGTERVAEEFADVLGCVFDSMRRYRVSMDDLKVAFDNKLQINKGRSWKDNGDGSYSHIK